MTDRELLELVAEVIGGSYWHDAGTFSDYLVIGQDEPVKWNPLKDDGDALRLAVKLGIHLQFGVSDNFGPYVHARSEVRRGDFIDFHECYQWVSLHPDANAAARRAVLEVAAAIGKAMK